MTMSVDFSRDSRSESFDDEMTRLDDLEHLIGVEVDGELYIDIKDLGTCLRCMNWNVTNRELYNAEFALAPGGEENIKKEAILDYIRDNRPSEDEQEQALLMAFQSLDKDGSGILEIEELQNLLMKHGETLSEEEVKDIIKESDSDKDGQLDYNEFINFMKKRKNFMPTN